MEAKDGKTLTFDEGLNQLDKSNKVIVEANKLITDVLLDTFLFSLSWWVALAMLIVPWSLWAIFRNKESSARLLYAAFIVMIVSTTIDGLGVDFGKWAYPVKVIPVPTISYSFRYGVIPVTIMFLIQFKPKLNPFLKAVLFGGLGAYIGMPIMSMLHLYKKIDWAYTYSFFILVSLYLIAHWFSRRESFEKVVEN
ncbi:CBO0543 family protein [Cytobacillus oceanisediminis]|uniref:CBO0543 family protein n=1 Tax=Cytobacillus oceanisediminis TaxID=665099 RepID=UPI002495A747|nr:CBO0543 family protein [Cytobacillus oceanisediminis]